jgi:glycosyltransferase involved in cell wall biosynthesis
VNYIVITPVRNEADRFPRTISSMAAQSLRPLRWVVVNDGSTDATAAVADRAARDHAWIRVLHRPDRGFRKQGGGVIDAFYDGYALLATHHAPLASQFSSDDWSFLVKLDGDLEFEPDYFARCFDRFAQDEKLGIGGGRVFYRINGSLVEDAPGDPAFHVRGATKIYRRATWKAIGGLLRAPGWDTLDELKANMLGWRTYSFRDLPVVQLKPTGSADGSWQNWFKNGRANYITGYHPLFMLSKCLSRLFRSPVGVASAGLFCGFITGYLNRVPQVSDRALVRYLRRQQLNRLLCRESLWN